MTPALLPILCRLEYGAKDEKGKGSQNGTVVYAALASGVCEKVAGL